jgi:hypothetical protein
VTWRTRYELKDLSGEWMSYSRDEAGARERVVLDDREEVNVKAITARSQP